MSEEKEFKSTSTWKCEICNKESDDVFAIKSFLEMKMCAICCITAKETLKEAIKFRATQNNTSSTYTTAKICSEKESVLNLDILKHMRDTDEKSSNNIIKNENFVKQYFQKIDWKLEDKWNTLRFDFNAPNTGKDLGCSSIKKCSCSIDQLTNFGCNCKK